MQGLLPRSPHGPSTRPGEEQGPGSGQWSGGVTFAGPCSPVMVTEPHQELHAALPAPTKTPTSSGRFVLLVSGLGLGGGGGESLLGTQLLVDVVTGQLGDEGEQCSAAHVSRVILAGNLLSHNTQSRDSINKVRRPPACIRALPCGASGTGLAGLVTQESPVLRPCFLRAVVGAGGPELLLSPCGWGFALLSALLAGALGMALM